MKIIGRNSRYYPSPDGLFVLGVALVERVDGYKAYAAIIPDFSLQGIQPPWQWIAQYGNELGYEEARSHFPSITHAVYAG